MNLTKIFGMQLLLDKAIMNAHDNGGAKIENIKEKRIVALLVELGEFANEYAAFKYWKKNKVIEEAKMIEEFVDGIHFLSTMAIELNADSQIQPVIINDDKSIQLLETFKEITKLSDNYSKKQLEKCFALYLGMAEQLGITDHQIETFYIDKNKTNFERIKNNY